MNTVDGTPYPDADECDEARMLRQEHHIERLLVMGFAAAVFSLVALIVTAHTVPPTEPDVFHELERYGTVMSATVGLDQVGRRITYYTVIRTTEGTQGR